MEGYSVDVVLRFVVLGPPIAPVPESPARAMPEDGVAFAAIVVV